MPAIDERTVRVKGLKELNRAFVRADKKIGKELRDRLREVAQPVAATAESLASSEIRNVGVRWPRMRVGVTRSLVYVAPRERGVKSKANAKLRRPRFADRLMDDAMSPALDKHAHELENKVGRLLDDIGRDWER